MEENIQWPEFLNASWSGRRNLISRKIGSSCSTVGLTETSNRTAVYLRPHCQHCNIQWPRVPRRYWQAVETLNASYKNQYFVSWLLSSGRPVVAWRTPVHLFTCSPVHLFACSQPTGTPSNLINRCHAVSPTSSTF